MSRGQRDLLILVAALAAPPTCVYCLPFVESARETAPRAARDGGAPRPSGDAGPADGAAPDGSDGGPAEGGGEDAGPVVPPGEVLARAHLGEGGEVRLEAVDEGYALRLVAPRDGAVSIEPLARLEGPDRLTLYMGPRCRSAAAGAERVVALWTGEAAHCVTEPRPRAVLRGRPPPGGCPVERAAAGRWTLLLHECGRLAEPAATLAFDLAEAEVAARAPLSPDGSPEDGR